MKTLSIIFFIGVIGIGLGFLYLTFDTFLNHKRESRLNDKLQEQKMELAKYTEYT